MICYDGYNNPEGSSYDSDTAIYNSTSLYIYACQVNLPTETSLATDADWPKYELYADHTLYENGKLINKRTADYVWCGREDETFKCKNASHLNGRGNSEEGYMQFDLDTSKQTDTQGVTKILGKAPEGNGQWQMVQW